MTKNIAAGMKEFNEAKEMVRSTEATVQSLEKKMVNEEVKTSLTSAEKRIFTNMGADNDVAMMLFQDFLFAGVGIHMFDSNMLDMLGIKDFADGAELAMAGQIAEEIVLANSDDAHEEYLKQHKEELSEREREYQQVRELELRAKAHNEEHRNMIYFLMIVMLMNVNVWANENTVDEENEAENDNNEPENNVVSLFGANKEAVRKPAPQPVMKFRNESGMRMALGM